MVSNKMNSDACEDFSTAEEIETIIEVNISNLKKLLDKRKTELKSKIEIFKEEIGTNDTLEINLEWKDEEMKEFIKSLGKMELREVGAEKEVSELEETIRLEPPTYESMRVNSVQAETNLQKKDITMQPIESVRSLAKRCVSLPTMLDDEADYQVMKPLVTGPDIDNDLYSYTSGRFLEDPYAIIDESELGELCEYSEYARRVSANISGKNSPTKKEKPVPVLDLPVVATCTFGKKLGQLNKPKGVALSNTGEIFVAEKGNNRVQVFSSAGNKLYSFGAGHMSAPYGVFVSSEFVYITLTNVHMLQMYAVGGEFVKQKGKEGREEGRLKHPTGIDGDEVRGKLFVCDTDNNRIQIFDNNLRFLKVFKTMRLDRPLEVKAIKFGTIVVLDRSPNCVHFISSTGEVMKEIVDTERYPMVLNPLYITLSPEGNILLSDFSKHCIHVFSEEGKPLWKIGQAGKGKPFEEPRGIVCDGSGRLVTVCNKTKNMLQIFDI